VGRGGNAFDLLPVLADAPEEAACTNANILAHLRSPGGHVRGCPAVDALLGKKSTCRTFRGFRDLGD